MELSQIPSILQQFSELNKISNLGVANIGCKTKDNCKVGILKQTLETLRNSVTYGRGCVETFKSVIVLAKQERFDEAFH